MPVPGAVVREKLRPGEGLGPPVGAKWVELLKMSDRNNCLTQQLDATRTTYSPYQSA